MCLIGIWVSFGDSTLRSKKIHLPTTDIAAEALDAALDDEVGLHDLHQLLKQPGDDMEEHIWRQVLTNLHAVVAIKVRRVALREEQANIRKRAAQRLLGERTYHERRQTRFLSDAQIPCRIELGFTRVRIVRQKPDAVPTLTKRTVATEE